MSDVSNQRPTQQYTTVDTKYQVAKQRQRIERALRNAGYHVKPSVHTYPPGRAAVLPRVIVVVNHD